MILDRNGMRPSSSKMYAVAALSRPTTVEDLRTFLGMTGYLRRFVKDYSRIAAPLTDILRNSNFATKPANAKFRGTNIAS